jgi:glycosyltransferase involved in cell wall biosynthesis
MIGVVALLSRPHFLPDVLANFERQTHPDKLLIIVENGPAVGAWNAYRGNLDLGNGLVAVGAGEPQGPAPEGTIWVIQSAPDRSAARNAGLALLREFGVDHFAFFEDDDLYGPGYLADYWAHRERADVLGKTCFVLAAPDGSRWLLHSEWESRPAELIGPYPGYCMACPVGSTLFGRVDRALPWPEPCPAFAEELDWCSDMLRARRTVLATSREHFVRQRFDDPEHGHATPGAWRDEVVGALRL